MSENEPFPDGITVATRFAEEVLAGLDDRVAPHQGQAVLEKIADTIGVLTSASAIDQLLSHALGVAAAAASEVLIIALAQSLRPDRKAIRRIESKVDLLIETPMRRGIQVFEMALSLAASPQNKRIRLHDAQQVFDNALALIDGQRARRFVDDNDWLKLHTCIKVLACFCAAARNEEEEARDHCAEFLRCLEDARKRCVDKGSEFNKAVGVMGSEIARLDRTYEEEKHALDSEAEEVDKGKPSAEAFQEYQAIKEGSEPSREGEHGYLSSKAAVGWYWHELGELKARRDELESRHETNKKKLSDQRDEALRQAAACEEGAVQCQRISALIDHTLRDLARGQDGPPERDRVLAD
jgi:hypothetical protein